MAFSTPAEVCMERAVDLKDESERLSSENFDDLFDIKRSADWIKENNFEKICLQLPDSLLGESVKLCKQLKTLVQKDVYILADTTYNSCCIDEVAARHINSDAIIHYGHSCMSPTDFPVLYVYPKSSLDIDEAVHALKQIDSLDIILIYDVSLDHYREQLCQNFFHSFPQLLIGVLSHEKGNKSTIFGRKIININGEEKNVDKLNKSHIVFIGNEGPTLFNIVICSNAENLYLLNPKTCSISPYSESHWFKRRRYLVERCKDSANIGILVCTLSIRNYAAIILRMKKLIRAAGKKCYTLTVGKPNIAKLANLSEIQLFVLVACPENELYSCKDFFSPIIYPYEVELALNQNRDQYDTKYSTDFNELLPEGRNHCAVEENGFHAPDVSLLSGNVRNMSVGNSKIDKESLKDMQVDSLRKEDWAVSELGIGAAISDRSWKGLEQDLGNTKAEIASVGRKGIASGYEGELF